MIKNILLSLFIIFLTPSILSAAEKYVAKVILMKGEARGKTSDGTVFQIKVDQDITEGSVIQTSDKSFVKLLFIDKSQMNLGPKSQMVINAFPSSDAGIITLVKGQLRSKVTKDYMEMDDKNKSKLFIKTSSAAMGIRGTDFQVNYNEENHNTALITFEGAVVMANINRADKSSYFDQHQLENVVSSEKAVIVKEGQISAVNLNISELAMVPTKLGTGQITALKENETGVKASTEASNESSNKQFKSPIPPGLDSAIFATTPKSNDSHHETAAANGFFNQKTGEYKLPAGSIIDLNSVNIIPPPVNAVFDPNSKMYVVPTTFGKIDASTGEYKAPEGLKLGNDGKFQIATPKEQRAPSSEGASSPKKQEMPNILGISPEMEVFTNTHGKPIIGTPPAPPAMTDVWRNIANDRLNTTEVIKNNTTATGVNLPTTRATFILNVH